MKFAFEILWTRDGITEPLFEPAPVNLQSIEAARQLAERFAAYVPVRSITIEAEDGSVFERWSWRNDTWGQHDPFPSGEMPAAARSTRSAATYRS